MELIKKINNNYALAIDASGEQIIVEGRGIGFMKMPCDIKDLSLITRTYYDTKEQDQAFLSNVDSDILDASGKVYEFALLHLPNKINPHLPFILADHIQFAIERKEKHITVNMPLQHDIQHLYPKEYDIASYAMKVVKEDLNCILDNSEIAGIAMNIINSEITATSERANKREITDSCKNIIETAMNIKIDPDSFSYSRFVSHLEYLFNRAERPSDPGIDSIKIYENIRTLYPEMEQCVEEITKFLTVNGYYLNNEEKLYLMLHVNRLCSREDCNR